jgi:hypothetical protein
MDEDFNEHNGLIDEDPALDYLIYKDMEQDQKNSRRNGGCLGAFAFFLVPCATSIFWIVTF